MFEPQLLDCIIGAERIKKIWRCAFIMGAVVPQGLGNRRIALLEEKLYTGRPIDSRQHLSGLLKYYSRRAA
jgi:hypothetical protein